MCMQTDRDAALAARFSHRCNQARVHLRAEMEKMGLREKDGWRISESMRQARGGSELVMRPLHLYLAAPDDIECRIWIGGDDNAIEVTCVP